MQKPTIGRIVWYMKLKAQLEMAIKQRNTYMFMLGECSEINVVAHSNQCDQEINEVGK